MKTNNSVVTRSPKRKLYPAALPSRKRQALAPLDSLPVDALKHRMCLRPRSRSVSPTESGVKKRKKKPYPPPFIIRPDSPVDASSSERMILRPKQKSPPQPSPTQNQEERPKPRKKASQLRPDSPVDASSSERMILRPKQKSPAQPSPTENQEERPEKIPAPVDARASEIPPPPTEKQEERREEDRAIANLLGEWMKLRRERLKRLTREHVMPMKDFTLKEANLCRYIFMKREWELGDTIPDNKKDLKKRLDIARETKGYGVTSRVGGVDGHSFFPLMSDLGEGGDPVLKRRVNTMIKKALLHVNKREMELKGKQRYKSAGVVNLVRISRYYLLTLRICLDNETHPPVEPRTVEALFFKHPASQVPVELEEWRMKMGSKLLFTSVRISNHGKRVAKESQGTNIVTVC